MRWVVLITLVVVPTVLVWRETRAQQAEYDAWRAGAPREPAPPAVSGRTAAAQEVL